MASKLLFEVVPFKVNSKIPFMANHSFTNSTICSVGNKMLNLEDEEDFELWKQHIFSILDRENEIFLICMMINKPYRLLWFKLIKDRLSEEDYAELLRFVWTSQENPNTDINVTRKECVNMFKKANKNYLMSIKEQEYIDSLDDKVIIYRGANIC